MVALPPPRLRRRGGRIHRRHRGRRRTDHVACAALGGVAAAVRAGNKQAPVVLRNDHRRCPIHAGRVDCMASFAARDSSHVRRRVCRLMGRCAAGQIDSRTRRSRVVAHRGNLHRAESRSRQSSAPRAHRSGCVCDSLRERARLLRRLFRAGHGIVLDARVRARARTGPAHSDRDDESAESHQQHRIAHRVCPARLCAAGCRCGNDRRPARRCAPCSSLVVARGARIILPIIATSLVLALHLAWVHLRGAVASICGFRFPRLQ